MAIDDDVAQNRAAWDRHSETYQRLHACVLADELPDERLKSDYFGLGRVESEDVVEWALGYGDWIRLFRRCGLEVLDLTELRPPEGARTTYVTYATLEWARRWPAEQVWTVRRSP